MKAKVGSWKRGHRRNSKQNNNKGKTLLALTSKTQQKRGRKTGEENMQNLMNAYSGGTSAGEVPNFIMGDEIECQGYGRVTSNRGLGTPASGPWTHPR